ncbi:MAG: hypothetical protein Q8O26_06315 [Phreatobacter sp.]|uniref:hypothetical protein n=1 Tax=Phreatobacter sp. TaxID=1966341 RepID=UPI002736B7DA|nr:hypothetical protein [Phreatobacter sp.]MDP2801481.1 hypothetical protein [Phreatobacter sp.]
MTQLFRRRMPALMGATVTASCIVNARENLTHLYPGPIGPGQPAADHRRLEELRMGGRT